MALIRKFRDIIRNTQPNDQTTILADRLDSENLGGVNYHVNNGPNGSNTPSSLNVSNSYHGGSDRPLIPADVTFLGENINVSFLDNEIKGTEEIYKRYLKNEVMENSTMNEEEFEKLLDKHQNQSVYERVDGGLKVYTINNEFFNGYVDSNIFKNSSSYYARFYNAITAAGTKLTEPVGYVGALRLGSQGFNVAQYWGSSFFKPRIKLDNTEDPYNPSGSYRAPTDTEDLVNSILTGEFLNPDSRRLEEIDIPDDLDELEAASQRIVKSYVPGLTREPQPFYAKNGLKDFLKQNILTRYGYFDQYSARVTKGGQINYIVGVGESGRIDSIDKVFKQLYTNNNSAPYYEYYANQEEINGEEQWNKGAIAQVAISEIERSGGKKGEEVFSFEKDADLLNYAAKVQGFSNNIADSVPQKSDELAKGDELPAVEEINISTNAEDSYTKLQKYDEYITQLGDRQYFPFLFETENRSKVEETKKEQVCQFQATIDNINETFNPNWVSKSFFGRTEQVNTYMQTDRSLSMSFTIFANTIRQLQNVYERVNWLAQQTYGQKQNRDNGSFKMIGGPIIRMTIGDMFFRMGGYIQSLAYDWNILGAGGKWEMTQGLRMPVACRVNITFRVLHDEMPNRDYNFYRGLMTNERILNNQGLIEGGGSKMQGFTVKGRGNPAKPLIPVRPDSKDSRVISENESFITGNPNANYSPDFDYYLKDLFYGRTSG
jgi:hypothetical protein